jgi:SAM-dependent methyltransferase
MRDSTIGAEMTQLAEFKRGVRAAWASGDYGEMARHDLWPMGERIVQRVGVGRGEDVLDVACGTGNAAIRAARAGGRVVGLDLTPELFETGRREAAAAGVEVEWVEGDAEALPFDDQSFDVVLSVFGCIFAPRHRVAARELARVLRPGGRLGIFAWAAESGPARFFKTAGAFMPPPPDFVEPSVLWGDQEHVRGLFDGTGVELEFERGEAPNPLARFGSVQERLDYYSTTMGPLVMLKRASEAQGRWPELRARLEEFYADAETPGEYLAILGRSIS